MASAANAWGSAELTARARARGSQDVLLFLAVVFFTSNVVLWIAKVCDC
jgi:hypothetical protein